MGRCRFYPARLPVLAVIGPSGSGKSSLLAAGILPALERSHYFAGKTWDVRTMRPGATPYDNLAAVLDLAAAEGGSGTAGLHLRIAEDTRLLLVVDQFEEVFTTAAAGQRERFEQTQQGLLNAPDFYLIVAARANFYANLMASPLWPHIPPENRLEVTPPRGDALRADIALPARSVGVELEPHLVERLLADAGDEPDVLPFVQETLVMLWAHAQNVLADFPNDPSLPLLLAISAVAFRPWDIPPAAVAEERSWDS